HRDLFFGAELHALLDRLAFDGAVHVQARALGEAREVLALEEGERMLGPHQYGSSPRAAFRACSTNSALSGEERAKRRSRMGTSSGCAGPLRRGCRRIAMPIATRGSCP